ncbi:flagella basal body P-ring formation protein FlgA [Pseudoxanthomonas sp. PXM02]|uniref:flagella basal body P-ring formation protein FlgA n=1 Tax=Pseudoxanthomonas sp. PXM02 TaxID=2769294 RepID=UPI00177F616F|nr:flagella basal body P-ring formation protein FlgA [Pseudoxanthomonas sp. PXM02]MBD9477428.1 flagella basal body P-ring formation protein FlgA [Pseudoxanthomonas sp. PXM02]
MNVIARVFILLLATVSAPCLAMHTVSGEQLLACAEASLRERSALLPGRLALSASAMPEPSRIEGEGEIRLLARAVDGAWPRRRVGVPVEILRGDHVEQTRMVWLSVQWWQQVDVYALDAPSGTALNELRVRTDEVDMAGAGEPAVALDTIVALEDWRLRRSVRAGEPLMGSDFSPRPAVSREQAVRLSLRQGPVALTVPAVANGEGELGQWVQVLAEGADRPVLARIVARGEVAIER